MKRTRYNRKPASLSLTTPSILDSLASLQQKRGASKSPLSTKHTLEVRSFSALATEDHGSSYVVIKKAACTAEVAASFDLRKATLTAQLLYDTQPPKPVDYVHKPPLEAFVHISENGQSARVESHISVLTSQHEDSLFRVRLTAITPDSTITDALSPPIKVISKADSRTRNASDPATPAPPAKRRRTASHTAATPASTPSTSSPMQISPPTSTSATPSPTQPESPFSTPITQENTPISPESYMASALATLAKAVIAVPPESRISQLRDTIAGLPQPELVPLLLDALSGALNPQSPVNSDSDTSPYIETPKAQSVPSSPEESPQYVRDLFFPPQLGEDSVSSWYDGLSQDSSDLCASGLMPELNDMLTQQPSVEATTGGDMYLCY